MDFDLRYRIAKGLAEKYTAPGLANLSVESRLDYGLRNEYREPVTAMEAATTAAEIAAMPVIAPRMVTVPLHVIKVMTDDGPLDCEDDDPVHVWISVTGWSPRRAYLMQGSRFAEVAECLPEELEGKHFLADLNLYEPPSADPETGERIELPNLKLAPALPEGWLGSS